MINEPNSISQSLPNEYYISIDNMLSTRNDESYYNNFSKHIVTKTETVTPVFTYSDYIRKDTVLHLDKYKLPELKSVAKYYKLHVSGNKPLLIERIRTFFNNTKNATIIQRVFRGHMVRYSIRLRGDGFNRRNICVNETDFYTLEPLVDITYASFFSYTDEQNYTYGFDIRSIVSLIIKTTNPVNPYNRVAFPAKTTAALYTVFNLSKIVFPEIWCEQYTYKNTLYGSNTMVQSNSAGANVAPTSTISDLFRNIIGVTTTNNAAIMDNQLSTQRPTLSPRQRIVELQSSLNRNLEMIRSRNIETRIRELFMEINLLGNYAEIRWFTDLDRLRLARFYQVYYDWWNTHSRLDAETRNNICIFDDPFSDVRLLYLYPTTPVEDYREACIRLMENMIYGSNDIEFRKLGAMHVLSILTIVSIPARNAMSWLYESLYV